MKNIIWFFFLNSAFVFAQYGEITADSMAYEASGQLWVKARYVTYEDGYQAITKEAPVSAARIAVSEQSETTQRAASWLSTLQYSSTIPQQFEEQKRRLVAIKNATGISVYDTIQKALIDSFLVSGWKIKEPSGVSDIVFSKTAGGQMRYKIGTATVKNCFIVYGLIQLVGYPATGQNTLFSLLPNTGNYAGPGRSAVIRRPGSTANKPSNKPANKKQ